MKEDIFSVDADLTALKELEETLKANPDKEWFEYDGSKWIKEDYVIPKSLVKEKIEELDKEVKDYQCEENRINLYQRKVLQELLERSMEDAI